MPLIEPGPIAARRAPAEIPLTANLRLLTCRKVQALAAYTETQEALANHTVIGHINSASGDIEHMARKNSQIANRYEKVLAVGVQRREAIVAGIARAKASKGGELRKG